MGTFTEEYNRIQQNISDTYDKYEELGLDLSQVTQRNSDNLPNVLGNFINSRKLTSNSTTKNMALCGFEDHDCSFGSQCVQISENRYVVSMKDHSYSYISVIEKNSFDNTFMIKRFDMPYYSLSLSNFYDNITLICLYPQKENMFLIKGSNKIYLGKYQISTEDFSFTMLLNTNFDDDSNVRSLFSLIRFFYNRQNFIKN